MERYSFSKLKCFGECKYEYLLNYVKCCASCRYYDPKSLSCEMDWLTDFDPDANHFQTTECEFFEKHVRENNAFAEYGTMVHEILEKYAKGEAQLDELEDLYDKGFAEQITCEFPPNKFVVLRDTYYQGGKKFFENFKGFGNWEVVGVEDEFEEIIDEDFILTGFIDLVFRRPDTGGIVVCDHKSKAKFKDKAEAEEYRKQLYTYALRIYRKFGEFPETLFFNMFRKQKKEVFQFDEGQYNEVLEWIRQTVKDIRSCVEYPHNYNEFKCNNLCNFRSSCFHKEQEELARCGL